MKHRTNDIRSFDELDLVIETLKDLTPSDARSADIRGGNTTRGYACECGSA